MHLKDAKGESSMKAKKWLAPGRTVTVCLAGASQDYQTVLTAWDDALVRLADEEEEALRKEARKAAAKRRDQQVQDAASIF